MLFQTKTRHITYFCCYVRAETNYNFVYFHLNHTQLANKGNETKRFENSTYFVNVSTAEVPQSTFVLVFY